MDPTLEQESQPQNKTLISSNKEEPDKSEPITPETKSGSNKDPSLPSTSSSFSSTGSSEGDDFFQLDTITLGNSLPNNNHNTKSTPITTPQMNTSTNMINLMDDDSLFFGHNNASVISTVPDPTQMNPSAEPDLSPNPNLNLNPNPDPNRIPASIFAQNKSSKPMEWSVTSNESLFSISMANFPIDHMVLPDKSVELAKLPEENDIKEDGAGPANESDKDRGDVAVPSNNLSSRSEGSASSLQSFAFPVLTGEGETGSAKSEPELPPSSNSDQQPPESPSQLPHHLPQQPPAQQPPPVATEESKEEAPPPAPAGESKQYTWCSCCPFSS